VAYRCVILQIKSPYFSVHNIQPLQLNVRLFTVAAFVSFRFHLERMVIKLLLINRLQHLTQLGGKYVCLSRLSLS